MNSNYEIYSNSPLVEAVFEIRFSGEPTIECNRDKYFNDIRNDYPIVKVPRAMESVPISFQPYSFEKKDASCSVNLCINKFFFSCKKYEGFQNFKNEALRVYSIFGKQFKTVRKLKRVGLRYINIIPITREKGILPLENYVNVKLDLPASIPKVYKNLSVVFMSQTEGGSITTRIEPALSPDGLEVLILDFDYAKEGDLDFSQIEKYIEESHQHTKSLFNDLITDNYKKVMKGEVV